MGSKKDIFISVVLFAVFVASILVIYHFSRVKKEALGIKDELEIKASETMNTAFFSNIKKVKEIAGLKAENTAVIYSGKTLTATKENGAYICWKEI